MAPALARPRALHGPGLPRRRACRRGSCAPGSALYDLLAGRDAAEPARHGQAARSARARARARARGPASGAGLYSDVVMDDARLAVAVARDAAAHGAALLTLHRADVARAAADGAGDRGRGARPRERRERALRRARDRERDRRVDRRDARATCSRVLRRARPTPAPLLRPSRGTHLVYPRAHPGPRRARWWRGATGACSSWCRSPAARWSARPRSRLPRRPRPTRRAHRRGDPLPRAPRSRACCRARAASARSPPSPACGRCSSRPAPSGSASREHRVVVDGPVVTIAGGKYTTFRVMARDTLAAATRLLAPR